MFKAFKRRTEFWLVNLRMLFRTAARTMNDLITFLDYVIRT